MKLEMAPVIFVSVGILALAVFTPMVYIFISKYSISEYGNNITGWMSESRHGGQRLIIGILSARENFEDRQTVRETWLKDIQKNVAFEKVFYKFVVGSKSCDIHIQNRKDMYSCEPLNFTMPTIQKLGNQNVQLFTLKTVKEIDFNINTLIWNSSVIIRHPVVVKRIGLHAGVKLSDTPIIVELYDENTEDVVLSARFSLLDPGIIDGKKSDIDSMSYRFQSVSHVLLPKDYECSLRILSNGDIKTRMNMPENIVSVDNSGGTVESLPIDDKAFYVEYESENKMFMGNLVFSLNDVDMFKMMLKNQPSLDEELKTAQNEISQKLEKENSVYNDLLFVNVTDVYRNLPLKLLLFHKWTHSEKHAQFVMKTDDDCYVDIKNILTELDKVPRVNKIWWGNFRENWFVERTGKWAEKMYRASEYPHFACGSGNTVSKDISDWLATNAEFLFPYQGEDTSMGIWLTALGPRYIENKEWFCDKGCDRNAFVIPQMSVQELRSLWKNKQECDNICGCE